MSNDSMLKKNAERNILIRKEDQGLDAYHISLLGEMCFKILVSDFCG